jgi:pyridoxamine 5'-phosphate oxidase family protein
MRMASLTDQELAYLSGERRLGRLATVDARGMPHVVPVGVWRYNAETATIDVSGSDFAASKKFRNVHVHPKAAFVVDDMASIDPRRPRAVMIQGRAEAIDLDGEALIRITPDRVVSWGFDTGE